MPGNTVFRDNAAANFVRDQNYGAGGNFGGAIGAAISWDALAGNTFSLGSTEGVGATAAQLHVTAQIVGIGFVWALVMGLLGGLLPALKAARLPVATALRAL